jgi:hypothetical protein
MVSVEFEARKLPGGTQLTFELLDSGLCETAVIFDVTANQIYQRLLIGGGCCGTLTS